MGWFESHLLTVIVFLPFVWAVLGLLLPTTGKLGPHLLRGWTLAGSLAVFALVLLLFAGFGTQAGDYRFVERASWIPGLGVSYFVGIDGISLWLIALTGFLTPLAVLGSFRTIQTRLREYFFLLLALETGMLGAFVALDVFLFYVFWEAMLVPMYFLIGIWGGSNRIYAATKFVIYTAVGSLLMLAAIFYLSALHHAQFGTYSSALVDLLRVQAPFGGIASAQALLFLAFALAFAIKVPLFPLHTWLPDAHTEAPTAGSVILAGVLLKMGGYGFLRFAVPLFPEAARYFQTAFLALGAAAIAYGAWMALAQTDVKKLVAYSSVSHMGYVIVGIFSLNTVAVSGAAFQLVAHGLSTGGLFLLVGMLYDRRHTRQIGDFGGLTKVMPLFSAAFMVITLASIALPGTCGFVAEFLILLGAWHAAPWVAVVATSGVIFGAVYMLWMFQRVMFGPVRHAENEKLKDLSLREALVLVPILIAVVAVGLMPGPLLRQFEPAIGQVLERTGVR